MQVWRLARRSYAALDGLGARKAGGRWNSPGIAAVYTASRLSLAVLELLVHVDPDTIPADLTAFEIEVPDDLAIEPLAIGKLPSDWRTRAHHPDCRAAGDEWLSSLRSPLLAVPSALIPAELNYLINPAHPKVARIRVVGSEPFSFDQRLLRKMARNPH